jgi:hypothetical protein
MKRIKATVHVILTLPTGAEVIQNVHARGSDMGAHIKAGGKLFRPYIDWLVFRPRFLNTKEEDEIGLGHGWRSCDDVDFEKFLSNEDDPEHPYTLEEID